MASSASAVRSGELMARIGGEEFAWLMPEANQDGAHAAAERVRRAIQGTPFDVAGTLTISAGVCSNAQAHTGEQLVGLADQALYWSKQSGRNTTLIYTRDTQRVRSTPAPSSCPPRPMRRRRAGVCHCGTPSR